MQVTVRLAAGAMQGTLGGQRLTLHSCPAPERRRPFQCLARKQLTPKESRIGKVPIVIPKGTTVKIDGQHIAVKARFTPSPRPGPLSPPLPSHTRHAFYFRAEPFFSGKSKHQDGGADRSRVTPQGPRGELAHSVDSLLEIRQAEDGSVRLAKRAESRRANEQHGLWRCGCLSRPCYQPNRVTAASNLRCVLPGAVGLSIFHFAEDALLSCDCSPSPGALSL